MCMKPIESLSMSPVDTLEFTVCVCFIKRTLGKKETSDEHYRKCDVREMVEGRGIVSLGTNRWQSSQIAGLVRRGFSDHLKPQVMYESPHSYPWSNDPKLYLS